MQYIKYLEKLLITKGHAGIPGLGLFQFKEIPSQVRDGKMQPPAKELNFEANLIETGQELVKEMATGENISEHEALEYITGNVNNMLHLLREGKTIDIQGIGKLSLSDGQIVLTPKVSETLTSTSFGLPDVEPIFELEHESVKAEPIVEVPKEVKAVIIPVEKQEPKIEKTIEAPTPKPVETPKDPIKETPKATIVPPPTTSAPKPPVKKVVVKRSYTKVLVIIGVIVATLALAYFVYTFKLWDKALSLFASKKQNEQVVPAQSADSLGIDTVNNKQNALMYNETPEKKPLTYYIISGSFKTKENADKYSSQMTEKGFTTYTLNYGDTLFRVAIFASQQRQEAVDEFIKLQNDKGMKIWLLSL